MNTPRVVMALLLAPLAVLAVLWLPTPWLAMGVGALMLGVLWEWSRLSGLEAPLPRAVYLTGNALLIAALSWGGTGSGPRLFVLKMVAIVGALWWLLAALWLWKRDFCREDSQVARLLKLLAGSFCAIPAWAALVWLHASDEMGPRWTLFAIGLVWAADTGAYFVGVRWGRRKLAPMISPGKSIEGLAGGMLAALLLAACAWPWLGLQWGALPALLALTLATALVSVLGDLFESLFKRHQGMKDSSNLIPGHGGLLDRVDSLLAALPVFVVGYYGLSL
jgi:phosphatidate cytidylyltransferase